MAKMSTPQVSSASMQQMIDAGLNAFALVLLLESYAPADRPGPPPALDFVFRGVRVRLDPISGSSDACETEHPCPK